MGCAAQKKQLTQNKMQEGQQAIKDHQFDNLINKIQTYKSLQVSRNHSPALKSSNSDIGHQISGKDHNEDKLDYIKLLPNEQDQDGNQVCFDITPMFGINSPENKYQGSMTFSQSLQGSPSKQINTDSKKQQLFRQKNKEIRKILKK